MNQEIKEQDRLDDFNELKGKILKAIEESGATDQEDMKNIVECELDNSLSFVIEFNHENDGGARLEYYSDAIQKTIIMTYFIPETFATDEAFAQFLIDKEIEVRQVEAKLSATFK